MEHSHINYIHILLRNINKKKDGYSENVPLLEISQVVLVYYNIVNNQYQPDSKILPNFISNSHSTSYSIYHQQIRFTQKLFIQNFGTLKFCLIMKTL